MAGALGREFEFSERHFKRLRAFATAQTGIVLPDAKKDMVYGRLSKRIRKQFAGSFDAFCDAIAAGNNEEHKFLINAITTNRTSFFREKHHFGYLKHKVIPESLRHNQASKKIRIWSAGCSTGEEPYSIAICLRAAVPDLDANVVAHGKQGIYAAERIRPCRKR